MPKSHNSDYLRVGKAFLLSGLTSESSLEHGTSSVSSHGMADGAEVLEDFLSLSSVTSGLLLLRWHSC